MSDNTSLEIYGFGHYDRSGKVRWLAHELGLEVTEKRLALGDHRGDAYREINPYASIPAVIWRGQTLTESTASCIYLAESFPESRMAVTAEEDCRYAYLRWIALCAESFELRLVDYALAGSGILPEVLRDIHGDMLSQRCEVLAREVPASGFLVAERFTVADIVAAYSLRLAVNTGLLGFADVAGYLQPLMQRQAAIDSGFFSSLQSDE